MGDLLQTRHDLSTYISTVREQIAQQEALLKSDRQFVPSAGDHAWDSEEMRRAGGAPPTEAPAAIGASAPSSLPPATQTWP